MIELDNKELIVVVQCHIVTERCSGYFCERAFNERSGGFAVYSKQRAYRTLYQTCGGCCGLALQRKLTHLTRRIEKEEGIGKDRVVVQLSSCITKDNYHGPPCPHLDFLKTLIARTGLDVCEDTRISDKSQRRRREGKYANDAQ